MPYYMNRTLVGISSADSLGDGNTIRIKWATAYPNVSTNKIAYNIYYTTNSYDFPITNFNVNPNLVSISNVTAAHLTDLTPGEIYYIGVRAIEYDPALDLTPLVDVYDGLKIYPQSLLLSNMTSSSTVIHLVDSSGFPSTGIVRVGVEKIRYNALTGNDLTVQTRAYQSTEARLHNTDGYDGYHTQDPYVSYYFGLEEQNTVVFECQNRFEFIQEPYTVADGYHQVVKDILTTDLTASDEYNVGFKSYDYAGWHRTDPVQLLTGECVGSYIGGEQFCADGYGGVGQVLRGMSLQEQNNQRQEMLLSLTGKKVIAVNRQWTGITCKCYQTSSEYPDDRCPNCFAPGTLVRTKTGYRAIETILIGDEVLSSDGNFYPVKNVFKTAYEGKLSSILTSTSTTPILATPEHPFMVLRGSHNAKNGCGPNSNCTAYIKRGDGDRKLDVLKTKYGTWQARVTVPNHKRKSVGTFKTKELAIKAINDYKEIHFEQGHVLKWEDAGNIKIKDWVATKWNKVLNDINSISIPQEFCKNTDLGNKRNGSEEFIVDEEFLWIIGIYLAEGSSSKRTINFALHEKEIIFQNKIISFFKKHGFSATLQKCKDSKGVCVVIHSTSLANWFSNWLGRGCSNKKIPNEFMSLPDNKSWAIINGIYDGDGSKRENEIVQTSEILALQLVELLHRLGEQPLTRTQQSNFLTPKGNKRKLAYVVNWKEKTLKNHNRKGRWHFNNDILSQVKKIDTIDYSGYVYNLEVEGDHTYIVQNTLVHNCLGTKFQVGWQQYFNPRRSDGRIMVHFEPFVDAVKMQEAGLESESQFNCWTLTVPTLKNRDFIVEFDQDGNEEYRYEIINVTRNVLITSLMGGQKFTVQRVRKTDPIYQVPVFRDSSLFPSKLHTSIASGPGIAPHSHEVVINEKVSAINQINQITSVAAGHSHIIRDGVVILGLGHTHTIVLP